MHKLGIIVPYRNREKQLELFKDYIPRFLNKQGIIDYTVIVVNQADRKKFNRGKLLNIGFLEAKARGCDYVIFHDVDMLPWEGDYTYSDKPLQIANKFIKDGEFNRTIQRNYFGGVTLFSVKDFEKINGYSNKYKGWGFEDDDLLLRCREVDLKLETESYRVPNFDRKIPYFNGKNSYVRIKNDFPTIRPYSYVTTFIPDPIECNPSEITDEYAVFGIPGEDLNLSYNSFSTYKFELFLNNKVPVSITSDYLPNMPIQAVVNVNARLKRIQFFINGKEVGTKYWGDVGMKQYTEQPYIYIGVADPNRQTKQKFFKGYIHNFGILHGELSLEEVRKLFLSDPNISLIDSNPEIKDRWRAYYDSSTMTVLNNFWLDASYKKYIAENFNVEYREFKNNKVNKIKFPYRRQGTFKLLKHDEAGYIDGFWKDWGSRENQMRYWRKVIDKKSDYENDGLSTCLFRSSLAEEEANYIKLNVIT